MTLDEIIPRAAVRVPLRARDAAEALAELTTVLAHAHALPVELVLARLQEREHLGSTALGNGVALPHGRGDVTRSVGALGISPRGLVWEPDAARVHVVVAVLSPPSGPEHVRTLAWLGRVLGQARAYEALLAAPDAERAHAVLVDASAHDPARA
jgi:PTS system nitrogen regulatory IIA component